MAIADKVNELMRAFRSHIQPIHWKLVLLLGVAGVIAFGGSRYLDNLEQRILGSEDSRTIAERQHDSLPNQGEVRDGFPQPLAEFRAAKWEWTTFYTGLDGHGVPKPLPIPNNWDTEDVEITSATPIWTDTLVIPAGRDVVVRARTNDVIHRALCKDLSIDATLVPGHETDITISTKEPGEWTLHCGEYCGLGHSDMKTRVVAIPAENWKRWRAALQASVVESQSTEKQNFHLEF